MQPAAPFLHPRAMSSMAHSMKIQSPPFPLGLPRGRAQAAEVVLSFRQLNTIEHLYGRNRLSCPGMATDYRWDEMQSLWIPVCERLFKYGSGGALLESVITRRLLDDTRSRQIFFYNGMGHLTESTLYKQQEKGWAVSAGYRIRYTYGHRNRIEEQYSEWYDADAGRWHKNTKYVFFYRGSKPCCHEYWRFCYEAGEWQPCERFRGIKWHALTESGHGMRSYLRQMADGNAWVDQEKYEAHFAKDTCEALYHTRASARWEAFLKVMYAHHTAGDTVLVQRRVKDDWQESVRYTCKRDDKGALAGWLIEVKKKNGWVRTYESNCLCNASETGNEVEEIWQQWDEGKGAFVNRERSIYARLQSFR